MSDDTKNLLVIEQLDTKKTVKLVNRKQLEKILAKEHGDLAIISNADKLTEEQKNALGIKKNISMLEAY